MMRRFRNLPGDRRAAQRKSGAHAYRGGWAMRARRGRASLWMLLLAFALIGFHCGSSRNAAARLYIQQQEWGSAERILLEEIAEHPANAQAWLLLGRVSRELGEYPDAMAQLNQAVLLDSTLAHEVDDEIASIPAGGEPAIAQDFRSQFAGALRADNYLKADGIRIDWLDYLEGTIPEELTNRGRRELDDLRAVGGLTDSLLIPWRRELLSALKAGNGAEARSCQERISERLCASYGAEKAAAQVSLLLLRELSAAERAELAMIDLFVSR